MDFEKPIRHLKVFSDFKENIMCDKLSQAYLFLCPDKLTNNILLKELAKLLQCENGNACDVCDNCVKIIAGTHPDVLIYPKSKNFMVEDATDVYNNVQVKPMLARYKVFIINDIDLSTEQAQNKMLKVLEEPPKNVIFLMSASTQEKVLATILSRVQKMTVDKMNKEELKKIFNEYDNNLLQIALSFGDGYIGKTLDILNNSNFIENYKNMENLIKNMKNSSQIPYFSPYFYKDKTTFENNLLILNGLFRDMLMINLNKSNLVDNQSIENEMFDCLQEYSANALTQILKRINKIKQMLDSNVNLTLLADNFLFDILEIKFLCK